MRIREAGLVSDLDILAVGCVRDMTRRAGAGEEASVGQRGTECMMG